MGRKKKIIPQEPQPEEIYCESPSEAALESESETELTSEMIEVEKEEEAVPNNVLEKHSKFDKFRGESKDGDK